MGCHRPPTDRIVRAMNDSSLRLPALLLSALACWALPGCDDGGGGGAAPDDAAVADAEPMADGAAPDPDSGLADAELMDGAALMDAGPVDGASPDAAAPDAMVWDVDYRVRAGVEYIGIWRSEPGTEFEVIDADGAQVAAAESDELGSLVFREVAPGEGYAVRIVDAPDEVVDGLTVLSADDSTPDEAFYANQTLRPGFGYLTTRDGTKLSIFVSLPGPVEDGPYPTLVNYSGYSPSQPGQSLGGAAEALCGVYPILCNAPSFPTGMIGGVMGYASVGVNMRGTGCSGGAYDFFDKPQLLDGYDMIEIIARQPWVKHNKVGMVGLSFPGISQLFVAATQPPSLASIAPMSVIADTVSSTLVPGGIYNNGFALNWIENVLNRAAPYGHPWIQDLVDGGDTICEDNQFLHSQKLDAVAKALENPFYTDEVAKPIDPTTFVDRITVPVFMTGQWQDEQTGPHFSALADKFVNAPVFRMIATNGVHRDGLAPQALVEWNNFLSLYVAQEAPVIDDTLRAVVPPFMERIFEAALELPPDRLSADDYEAAKAMYEAEPQIQIIFESGAPEAVEPGAPEGTFSAFFDSWPIPETVATRWYFQPDGSLGAQMPGADQEASVFEHDPEAGARGTLARGSVDHVQPAWDWQQLVEGKALSFVTAPLAEDVVMVGHGSVDLWLRSTADDADLEVMLTEVRADGTEQYVQAGWLRASHRGLREDATALRPIKAHTEDRFEPLVPGEWTEARVELMPFGHIFRAGSRLRISVDTPGDSMAEWRFLLTEFDVPPSNTIGHSDSYPSSILLPVIPNIDVPTEQVECIRLRGQPCREFVPYVNTPAP